MSVPVLRFNGFNDLWNETKIGEITKKVGSGSTPRGGFEVYQQTGIPFIRSQNVNNEQLLLNDITFISDEINNKMRGSIVKPNDILLNITGASIGRSCVVPTDFEIGNVNQHVCIVRLNEKFEPKFLQPFLSSSRGQKLISNTQVGSGREGLNFEAIKSFKFFAPSYQEQTKIANFLTAFDEKISLLTQKHDLLTQYKKGVMQQIFTQELRFKDDDGRDFPEWKTIQLSELGKSFSGLTGKAGDDFGEGMPYITYKQIFDNSKIDVSKFAYVQVGENEKQNLVQYGDVFFTTSSETPEEVGFCSVLLNDVENVYLNSFCFGFRINSFNVYHPNFARFLFKSSEFRRRVILLAQGSTRFNISKTSFMDIEIKLPSITEQTKIANFLNAIDDKITATKTQLEGVKQYKQGLLQKMFV